MNDAECKLIEQESVEKVRKALKTLTSAEIYDNKGYLNEKGYKALEEIEGLDLFWICDPMIKLAKEKPQGEWIDYDNTFYKCPDCGYLLEKCCPQCQNKVILPKGGAE